MESFEAKKFNSNNINGGQQLQNGDALTASMMNDIVEGLSYATEKAETTYGNLQITNQSLATHQIYANNTYSNALKGKKIGTAVRIDDVSPIWDISTVEVSGVEDVSAVKVIKCGKNLFDISKVIDSDSQSVVNNGDGSITVTTTSSNGNVSANSPNTLRDYAPHLKVGQWYKLSAESTGANKYIYLSESGATWRFGGDSLKITEEHLNSKVRWYASGTSTTAIISNIQIELGTTATDYEPYIEPTEHTPNTDGTVGGVTLHSTTTTLTTDTEGAIITAEYNRDINKAFEQLYNAIISLGGTV